METYQSFFQGEIRILQITINDQDGAAFVPTSAFITIKDDNNIEIVAESAASIDSNKVSVLINTTVTATIGKYKVIWCLIQDSYTYYHITELEIVEL